MSAMPSASPYDIVIDVLVDGRTLTPGEIPPAVSEQIAAAQKNGDPVREIEHAGIRYRWSIRPCVYP
jgi:hypothetical protein